MRFPVARLLICSTLAVLASCSGDSPTEPSGFSGGYVLEAIDGTATPIIDFVTINQDTVFITGGSVNVLSRGRLRIVKRTRTHLRGRPPSGEVSDTLVQVYRMLGDTVFIDYQTGGLLGPYTDTALVGLSTFSISMLVNRYNLGHFWRQMFYVRQ